MLSRLYDLLSEHISDNKRKLFDTVLEERTRHVTLIMEDLYQAQNTSAIQRSAESFGIQDLHVIENKHVFSHHRRISKGSADWITMHRYNEPTSNNTETCINALKRQGYQVVVTALHEKTISLHEVDLSRKTAVLMGTELTGASEAAMRIYENPHGRIYREFECECSVRHYHATPHASHAHGKSFLATFRGRKTQPKN